MGKTLRQERERTRRCLEHFAAAFDLEFSFEYVERLIFAVVDVLRRSLMRRHDPSVNAYRPPVSSPTALYENTMP